MKKITFLMMLFVASVGLQAQTWDFNADPVDSNPWLNIAATKTQEATYYTIYAKDGIKNPGLSNETANVATADAHIMAITVQNHDANGPAYIRVGYLKAGSTDKYIYKGVDITNGDTEFKTYYIDLSNNSNWVDTKNGFKIWFKNDATVDFTGTSALEQIDIDKIEMIDAIPTTEKHVFNFDVDNDLEGWVEDFGDLSSAGGILTYTPQAGQWARLTQTSYHVVADDYNWFRIKVKNNSTSDNEIRLITSAGSVSIMATNSDATEQTYEVLLDTLGVGVTGTTTWTGDISGYKLRFSDATGKSTGTGSFEINSIEFFQAPGLSNDNITKDDVQLSIYPNPVKGFLTVKSSSKVNSLQIYNVAGQEVLNSKETSVNTTSLTKGVYILKVSQEGGNISTKRFIKQ